MLANAEPEKKQFNYGGFGNRTKPAQLPRPDQGRSQSEAHIQFTQHQPLQVPLPPPSFDPLKAFKEAFSDVAAHQSLIVQCSSGIQSPDLTAEQLAQINESKKPAHGTPNIPSQAYLQSKRKSVFWRAENTISEIGEHFTPPKYEKSKEKVEFIIDVLKKCFLMDKLTQLEF